MIPYSAVTTSTSLRNKGANNPGGGDDDDGDEMSMVQQVANATLMADNRRKQTRYPVEIRKVFEFSLCFWSSIFMSSPERKLLH